VLLAPFKTRPAKQITLTQASENPHIINLHAGPAAALSEQLTEGAAPPPPKRISLLEALQMRQYWGKLLGTAGGWFLFDITFYGNSLFTPTVLKDVFHKASAAGAIPVEGDFHHNQLLQVTAVAAIGLPGYYVSVWLMDVLGRRNIQLQGFVCMAIAFGILGLLQKPLEHAPVVMLIVYGLTFFFSNFGPNSTTFILPAETFPVHMRTTLNGFSAAMGKVGATLGTAGFKSLVAATSVEATMLVCAGVSLMGFVVTLGFVEDRRGMAMEGQLLEGKEERSTMERGTLDTLPGSSIASQGS